MPERGGIVADNGLSLAAATMVAVNIWQRRCVAVAAAEVGWWRRSGVGWGGSGGGSVGGGSRGGRESVQENNSPFVLCVKKFFHFFQLEKIVIYSRRSLRNRKQIEQSSSRSQSVHGTRQHRQATHVMRNDCVRDWSRQQMNAREEGEL